MHIPKSRAKIQQYKLTPIDRLPKAITRFIRATYSPPGKTPAYYLGFKPFNWHLMSTPLITEIKRIPEHECSIDMYGSYGCCFGMSHVIETVYATEGYGASIGARFDHETDKWIFQVWMD